MSGLVPLSTYNLAVKPFKPVQAVHDGYPVTVRLTLAAVDPEPVEEGDEPSTLRILKKKEYEDDSDEEDEDYDGKDSEESGDEDEEEEDGEKLVDDEAEEKPKKGSKSNKSQDDEEDEEEEEDDEEGSEEDDDEDEEDDDEDVGEFVLCTLSPKVQYQQALDFTITPDEEVYFVVTGSYPVHLSGNYVEHPADTDEEDYEDDEEENLTPDEEDVLDDESYDLDDLENEPDVENKIEELVDEDDEKKQKKRSAEEEEAEKPEKKSKKSKKDGKKVQFSQQLEQGPSETAQKESKEDKSSKNKDESKDSKSSSKKYPTEALFGGVVIEDRKKGSGPTAKDNNKVAIRYIGKLKNGSVFDKNTSGKPFSFKLGKGECIKGFDVGVSGMAAGGERRIIIPPKMGYGNKALPGLPANSELVFDVKLVSIK